MAILNPILPVIFLSIVFNWLVGREGLEPTESEDTAFTVLPATNYGLPSNINQAQLSNSGALRDDSSLVTKENYQAFEIS